MYIYTLSIEMNNNYESGLFKKGTKFSDKMFRDLVDVIIDALKQQHSRKHQERKGKKITKTFTALF